MDVLIGIVSKNRAAILPRAIESALAQVGVETSVMVIDDHSEDNTRELVSNYPSVHWEFLSESKGYLFARNKMMQNSDARFFCSLDDDSWFLDSDTLAKAIRFLDSHPDVAAIGFDILSPDDHEKRDESPPYETNNFIGCGHMLRLSAMREVNFYDPNPGFYGGEEKDLCLKLINKGHKIMAMPGLNVWHDKTNVSRNLHAQHRSGVCNDLVFWFRRAPFLYLLPGLMIKIIKHIWFSARYKSGFLFLDGLSGIGMFLSLAFRAKLKRSSVSPQAFKIYNSLKEKNA
jgi:GT2 family glycosyltransferase